MTLSSQIAVQLNVAASKTLDLGVTAQANLSKTYTQTLTNGTGAGKADLPFQDTRTIAPSGTDDLDLSGVLTSPLGDVLTMVRVKSIVITASAANTNNVVVGGAPANAFSTIFGDPTDKVTVRPGATFTILAGSADATGYLVTPATGDILRVANSGAGSSVDYDIIVNGASA